MRGETEFLLQVRNLFAAAVDDHGRISHARHRLGEPVQEIRIVYFVPAYFQD